MYERCNYYISISISIILGIILGILFYFGIIQNTETVLIVLTVFSFINFIIFTIYSLINGSERNNGNERNSCKCRYLRTIFISVLGTILLVTLGFLFGDLTINLIFSSILIGLISIFFFSQIINIYFYISCMIGICPRCIDCREYNDCNNYRNYYYDNRSDNF